MLLFCPQTVRLSPRSLWGPRRTMMCLHNKVLFLLLLLFLFPSLAGLFSKFTAPTRKNVKYGWRSVFSHCLLVVVHICFISSISDRRLQRLLWLRLRTGEGTCSSSHCGRASDSRSPGRASYGQDTYSSVSEPVAQFHTQYIDHQLYRDELRLSWECDGQTSRSW